MVKNYVTVEFLKDCIRFKKGQVCQIPETLAKLKISRGEAKIYEPEKISKKTVSQDDIVEKKVINKKNIE